MDSRGAPAATVCNEVEAEVICGLLRSAGIECAHRLTDETDSPLHGTSGKITHAGGLMRLICRWRRNDQAP
jgi:hypothetical protein